MFELSESTKKGIIVLEEGMLKIATEKIDSFQQIAKNSIYAISMILSDIAEKPKEYLEGSNFSTIADYAEEMFGYKKAYTYKLIKIAKFIAIKDKTTFEIIGVDKLLKDEIESDYYFDIVKDMDGFEFSPSQLLELIPLTKQQIEDNIKELDSSLTCKQLRGIVKNIVNPPIEATATVSTEDSTESTESTEEEKTPLTDKERIMQMLEICSNIESEDIKTKIVNVFQKSLKLLER